MRLLLRVCVLALCAFLGIAIAAAMLQLPEQAIRLTQHVAAHLDASGVTHPVTAVLLNFRGYDTLLEIAVLLLALLGVLAVSGDERRAGLPLSGSVQPILQSMARLVVPSMVLVAGYLLWSGSHSPGGAFQAGAVLAAAGVLLHLAAIIPAWTAPNLLLRAGLVSGFLIFLAVAAAMLLLHGALLQYPPRMAGMLILLIETGLTLSLGLLLAGLFLWLPNENVEAEE